MRSNGDARVLVVEPTERIAPSAQNFDPDELSFRIEVEDDLARRSSASTRRSILGVDR